MNIQSTVMKAYEVKLVLNQDELTALLEMFQNSVDEDECVEHFTLRHHLYNELNKILKG